MKVLVTGGAGYIGSFMVRELLENNHTVTIIDNLSEGHKKSIPKNVKLIESDFANRQILQATLKNTDAVLHFAASIQVSESIKDPQKYLLNNFEKGKILVEEMQKASVNKLIFSSTCAIYGNPKKIPITEKTPYGPINPYGESKLKFEQYLETSKIKSIRLRYFNASGALPDGSLGEDHFPETHLIPNVLKSAIAHKPVPIYGIDYNTKDGTCIRDYIHVMDLAQAHLLALKSLDHGLVGAFNLGSEKGFSVKQIIKVAEKVSKTRIHTQLMKPRIGDPPKLIANSKLARSKLKWKPKNSDIKTIIKSAYLWHRLHPKGFK